MPDQGDPPSYEDIKPASTPAAARAPESAESTSQQDVDAAVVILCHYDRSKPKGRAVIGSCHEAVLLPSNMTQQGLMRLLRERTIKRQRVLKITKHGKLYSLVFDNSKNATETVPVIDEQSWQACRVLMKKTPGSRLMFYAFAENDTESGSGSLSAEQTQTKKKKCVVQ